ncbi:MAG TPA: HRDC domain-containing protein [Gammaproteobacteria bacterium]|jgi:ribonuclease D
MAQEQKSGFGKLVVDARDLAAVSTTIAAQPLVAIDTEFVRERTYYPELCLIQVGADDLVACVDCLAGLDLNAFLDTLLRPDCAWVLHSARQDLEVLWNLRQAPPARVIDTQIAASLIGFSPQLGLQDLLAELFGVRLDKGHARTDWSRRPLAPAALAYAFDDVRYLLRAWQALCARLIALGRLEWLEEDCAHLVAEPPVAESATLFQRLRGVAVLKPRAQCAALALLEWRERHAREVNRPRRWVLGDDQLLRICRALPEDAAALSRVPDLPRQLISGSAQELVRIIAQSDSPNARNRVESLLADPKRDSARVAAVRAAVNECAVRLGIDATVLATRRDIAALAAGTDLESVLPGWRARALEALL